MTTPLNIAFGETDLSNLTEIEGLVGVIVEETGKLDPAGRKISRAMKSALGRFAESDGFSDMKEGDAKLLAFPAGMAADGLVVIKLAKRADIATARRAGAQLAKLTGKKSLTMICAGHNRASEVAYGLALRAYQFTPHKTDTKPNPDQKVSFMVNKPEEVAAEAAVHAAMVEGVFFTRDLTNEPANVLTTEDFAARLAAMQELGLDVEIHEEADLEKLGMGSFLSVGHGSPSPTKMVVMKWNGGGDEEPFAFVGKGVVFDTGGISIKPSGGMEDMTMDMGGAGVVAGVMRALALRKAKANVVGLVGLVENMPDGHATRPGDVVTSMKGTTIEVINTDAEGRLVLADVLWYTQDRFNPSGIINLATLTGAMIIALGHEHAGVFSNSDDLSKEFLKAAEAEGEGAWRLPMGPAYDKMIKSRIADIKNSAGRPAGSITAAQFLKRFVKDETPWIHLDIAGVASVKAETDFAPNGATGWGVRALDRLIRDNYEAE